MHTLAKNQHHNTRLIYDFLEKAYPGGKPSFHKLVEDNIINGTQLIELAVSRVKDIEMCPFGYNRDLVDDSDVKTVTILKDESIKRTVLKDGRKRRYKSVSYVAKIADVDKKYGVLRVIAWNPFAEKYHYFKIPPSAILGLKKVTMTFDPANDFEATGKYSKYEVSSFDEVGSKLTLREVVDTIVCNITPANIDSKIDQLLEMITNDSISQIKEKFLS